MAKKLRSEMAIDECISELKAACRIDIEPGAIKTIADQLRHNFVRLLDGADGEQLWWVDGPLMRDNARFMGTFAEFYAVTKDPPAVTVGPDELGCALDIVSAQCKDKKPATILFKYCA